MTKSELAAYKAAYESELFESVVPFWERHSADRECGGYFSCLDRDGAVFDTDKFLWMQGRELWGFSHLYRRVAPEPRWLDLARLGALFLKEKGRAPNGDFWFALDRAGNPLVQPYNIFSDCFCAIGFAEYGRITGESWATELAVATYRRIQERVPNPKGVWTKQIGENRPIKAMSMPMMQIWMAHEMGGLVSPSELDPIVDAALSQVLTIHLDRGRRALFERVFADGSRPDCMEGRLLTPGHALETLWFAMRVAQGRGDEATVLLCRDAMLWTVERGWDAQHGGIYYYQDFEGRPPDKIESNMKLWWVHAEALCALLLAYKLTGDEACAAWFAKVHEWSWSHFRDPQFGEWYGYLDRRGEAALSLKGGKWKGFFHIPRALLECLRWLEEMEAACPADGPYRPPAATRRSGRPGGAA